MAIGLVCLCSCATPPEPEATATADLPAEVAMNKLSSFAPRLMVTLHLENGAEFKCCLDTGSPGTILPKAAEPQLGKRIGRGRIRTADGDIEKENLYAAPRIYLGDTQLITEDRIATWTNAEGILGMDCLRHYCLQLDFQTMKIRFLQSSGIDAAGLGRAIPLTSLRYAYIRQDGFFERNNSPLLVDTGDPWDGMMNSRLVKQALQEQKARPVPLRGFGDYKRKAPELVSFPTCVWNGETYTNLIVEAGRPDMIGLRFLARHLVTFDFPKKVMYLKYTDAKSDQVKASPWSDHF